MTDDMLAIEKFGVGQPVRRSEDPVLVRGEGCYTDDVRIEGQVYASMVRSQVAHGVITRIDTSAARSMKGVLDVFTQTALAAEGFGDLKTKMVANNRDGTPMKAPTRPLLADGRVRFVGEVIACVVAKTPEQAQDAAEAVQVEIDPLPAVVGAAAAAASNAPKLFGDMASNVVLDFHSGDAKAVEAAFDRAHHVSRLAIRSQRLIVNALEPRGGLCTYDAKAKRFTLHLQTQGVKGMQASIAADVLKDPAAKLHILTGNIGGSFGMKSAVFPEYACLMYAARRLKKPVKWTDRRSESFVSDFHGRDHERVAELALDKRGRFLAVRLSGYANIGAYLTPVGALPATVNSVKNVNSVYAIGLIESHTRAVLTNTAPIGPYRGAGRPEANYFMERLIETAAREMGIDSISLRRRNHIHPDAFPYKAASGMTYDSGNFGAVLDRTLDLADWKGFSKRKAESRKRGKLRGRGVGQFLEVTAPPGKEMAGIRFDPEGMVTVLSGTMDFGMGHHTAFAQVLSSRLGIPFEKIRLVQGDSDRLAVGGGSGGSKSMQVAGETIAKASDTVIEKGRMAASFALEAGVSDIEFQNGRFSVAGTDKSIGLLDLVAWLRKGGFALPEDAPKSLDSDYVTEGVTSTFPNGCHIAEVEIDPETGSVAVVRYAAVNDCGTVINPLLVEGQAHGGIVQGIGQALCEDTIYDEDGQLLSGSFMDYCMPRADDVPNFVCETLPSPARTNVMGIKGIGEAGCAGALPSVMNAVIDALSIFGIKHIDMPATPSRVHAAIKAATVGNK